MKHVVVPTRWIRYVVAGLAWFALGFVVLCYWGNADDKTQDWAIAIGIIFWCIGVYCCGKSGDFKKLDAFKLGELKVYAEENPEIRPWMAKAVEENLPFLERDLYAAKCVREKKDIAKWEREGQEKLATVQGEIKALVKNSPAESPSEQEKGDAPSVAQVTTTFENLTQPTQQPPQAAANEPQPPSTGASPSAFPSTVSVDTTALHAVLQALVGPPHLIRELVVIAGLGDLAQDNPIGLLVQQFNSQMQASKDSNTPGQA